MTLRRLLTASAWISAGLLAGRLAGFVRESTLAGVFGAGQAGDAAVLVLTVPDLLANVLAGGALSVALVPEFRRLGAPGARRLFLRATMMIAVAFSLLSAALALVPGTLIATLAPGLGAAGIEAISGPMRLCLWSIPLTALAGVSTAYLQSRERFAIAALGTLIFNAVMIVALATVVRSARSLDLLALATIAAALARWLSQLAALPTDGDPPTGHEAGGAGLLARYGQALVSGGCLLLLPVIVRALASFGEEGGIARVTYAMKLVELPLGACVTVLSIALFPRLALLFSNAESVDDGTRLLREGVLSVLALAMASTLAAGWFAGDLARLVYGWGSMTPEAVSMIGLLAAIGFLSLAAQGVSSLVVAAFNAKRDVSSPMWIHLAALPLVGVLGWAAARWWGLAGIIIALTTVYWLVALAQVAVFRSRHGVSLWSTLFGSSACRIAFAAACGFAPVAGLSLAWRPGLVGTMLLAAAGFALANAACVFAVPHWRVRALSRSAS